MDHETEVLLLEELLGLKQAGAFFLDDAPSHNAVREYTDPTRFVMEQASIFQRLPLIIAHASELPSPNSFLRRTINGRALLLLRGDDGQARVFLNVCRHRGTRLVDDDAGCKRRHACPYHAWTWDSRGRFVNAPHFDAGFPGLNRDELGLKSVPVAERHGFIWTMPSHGPNDLGTYLGDMDDALAWAGTEHLELHQADTQQRRCNWKILVEGGIEAYHFRVAHRKTIAPLFNDNLSSYQCLGPHMRSVLPRATITELSRQDRAQWRLRDHSNVLLNVFPNSSLLVQSDHVVWISMNPIETDHSEVRIATLKPTGPDRPDSYWTKNHAFSVTTLNEDFDLGESIQSGLLSGANTHLRFGRFEGALQHFNKTVRDHLQDPTDRPTVEPLPPEPLQ